MYAFLRIIYYITYRFSNNFFLKEECVYSMLFFYLAYHSLLYFFLQWLLIGPPTNDNVYVQCVT